MKIGWLCQHCNDESGVAAGDTLRVTVSRSESGEPRLIVQGLVSASSDELSTLGTREAALVPGQSLLVIEAGTAGSVSFRDESSKLARLPIIGRTFHKSKQVLQTAQRLIILTATPVGPQDIGPAATTVRQTASISKLDSLPKPAPEVELVAPQIVTTATDSHSVADRPSNLFASKKSSESSSRTFQAGSIHGAEKKFPRRNSYRPRRPIVKCAHCEATARSLPQLETVVSEQTVTASQRIESAMNENSIPEIPDTRPVVFETAPAHIGTAPMINLPLPVNF
jgi:hypothetical protein